MRKIRNLVAVIAVALLLTGAVATVPSAEPVAAEPSAEESFYLGQLMSINSMILATFTYGGANAEFVLYDPQVAEQFVAGFYVWMYVADVFEELDDPNSLEPVHETYRLAVQTLDAAAPGCISGVNLLDVGLIGVCTEAIITATGYIQQATALMPQGL